LDTMLDRATHDIVVYQQYTQTTDLFAFM